MRRRASRAYPNSALSRICLLQAYNGLKAPPDSVIASRRTRFSRSIRPACIALVNLGRRVQGEGRQGQGDREQPPHLARRSDESRRSPESIVDGPRAVGRARQGAPDHRHAAQGESAAIRAMMRHEVDAPAQGRASTRMRIATGEELIKARYERGEPRLLQSPDRRPRRATATPPRSRNGRRRRPQKFPNDASFPTLLAQSYRKSGQLQQALQAARRATEIDPKNGNAWLFAVVTANDLNMPDSAVAFAQQAIAAGADKDALGQALLAVVNPAVKKATGLEGARRLGSGAQGRTDRRRRGSERSRRSSTSASRRSRSGSMRSRTRRSSPAKGQGAKESTRQGMRRGEGRRGAVGDGADRDARAAPRSARRAPARSWGRFSSTASTSRR